MPSQARSENERKGTELKVGGRGIVKTDAGDKAKELEGEERARNRENGEKNGKG